MRLLCIANPEAYRGARNDVAESYARLAAHPGITLFHADTKAAEPGTRSLPATAIEPGFAAEGFPELGAAPTRPLGLTDVDLVFCRTLKPFPPGYLDALCAWAERGVRFVNDPRAIRRQIEPGFLIEAAGPYLPPTIVASGAEEAVAFLAEHGGAVLKRPNSTGGRGIYRIAPAEAGWSTDHVAEGERRFERAGEAFAHARGGEAAVLLMRFLPRVVEGDRRIVVVGGRILGAYLRRSPSGHWIQNVSAGGDCHESPVEPEDEALVAATAPAYSRIGIHVLGYDLLRNETGNWRISEINAGNVGGLARLDAFRAGRATQEFARWLIEHAGARATHEDRGQP